nr:MAG TPA: hypothetical protein [Caudoviricetes sp.]
MRRLLTSIRIDIIFLPFLIYFCVAFMTTPGIEPRALLKREQQIRRECQNPSRRLERP